MVASGLPLTVNAVIHRANVARAGAMVELAIALGARRVEIAHTQYYGWASLNREALMPGRADAERAVAEVERLTALGATEIPVPRRPADADWRLMADPEGNRFDVARL